MKTKEGGVMDIQKEREAFLHEFEKTDQYRQQYGFYKIPLRYDEQKEIWNFYDVQAAWEMWQAAKAQANKQFENFIDQAIEDSACADERRSLQALLDEFQDIAHDRSTGPSQ